MFEAPDAAVVITALISATVAIIRFGPQRGGPLSADAAELQARFEALRERMDKLEQRQDRQEQTILEWLRNQ